MDPFIPVLLESDPVQPSPEQLLYIKMILDKACSDSRFAEKAYASILLVLTSAKSIPPKVNSINPTSAALGSPSFTLHVMGEGFDDGAQIVWNGTVESTTRVSETELTTGVNMDTAEVAIDIPVQVQNPNGTISNIQTFSLTDPLATRSKETKKPVFTEKK